MLYLKTKLPVN